MSDARFSLDMIDVANPCTVPWNSMRGDDRVRHCDQCRQNVYQLSAMSKEEAEDLIRQKEGKLCVRFYRRRDGTVVTRDCGAVRWSRAVWMAAAFVVFGIFSIFAAMGAPQVLQYARKWYDGNGVQGGIRCFPPTRTPLEIAPPPREVKTPAPQPKE